MSPSTPSSSTSAGPRLTTVPIFIRAACENCRTRKLKCSGQPTDTAMQEANLAVGGPEAMLKCARCAKEGSECVFASRAPIGRPKKRKSEDGTELPASALASANTSIDPSANISAGPSSSTPRPRAPARKRTKKDANAAAGGAAPPGPSSNPHDYHHAQSEHDISQEHSHHAELVANAAAAAAAAIAMGANRVNYDDDHHNHHHDGTSAAPPPPPPTLPRFNDVSSPAAAASTLLDFRYQQQPTTSSSSQAPTPHANGRSSSSANPAASAVAAAAAAVALAAADARTSDTPTIASSAPAPYHSSSANGSGSGPTMSQLIDAEDRQYRQNHMNGVDSSLKQERDRDPLHASSSGHPQYNSSANDNSDPFYDGVSEEGSILQSAGISLDKSQSHVHQPPSTASTSQSLNVQQDFRGRPQQGLHRIPRAPEFDPGPAMQNNNTNVIYGAQHDVRQKQLLLQQHQTPRPFNFHPHYLTPEATPSMSIQPLASGPSQPATPGDNTSWLYSLGHRQMQTGQQTEYQVTIPSTASNQSMALYDHSMSASNSYSSFPPTTPMTEVSAPTAALVGGPSIRGPVAQSSGSHPTFNAQSLADFLSSLDTLSLTASDGLTPAMLDSSSLSGTFPSLEPVPNFPVSAVIPSTAPPMHGPTQNNIIPMQHQQVEADGVLDHPQNLVLGSALFTDLSQNGPQSTSSVAAKHAANEGTGGNWMDAIALQTSNELHKVLQAPTVAATGASSFPAQGGPAELSSHQNLQQHAGVAVTATTEELAGLSYAVPADFSWWDDFFSKGPFIPHATNTATHTDQRAQSVAAKGSVIDPASAQQNSSDAAEGAHRPEATPTTKKDCCQLPKDQTAEAQASAKPAQPVPSSCCSSKALSGKDASTSEPQALARTSSTLTSATVSSDSVASERSGGGSGGSSSGRVHCVPDPKGEGCTCLCNADVALLSVRRVLQRTEAIPLGEGESESSPRLGGNASNAVATTLHLTLSASQAVSAQCACSADCPTCREDNNVWGSAGKQRQRQLSQPGTSADGASPRIVSASLLVSTALQIYARAVKMLRETLTSAAPPELLGQEAQTDISATGADREATTGLDVKSCAYPGHARTHATASTQATDAGVMRKHVAFPNIAPPFSPPTSCCGTSASTDSPILQRTGLAQDGTRQTAKVVAPSAAASSSPGLDIDIKIGSTYRPLPHNARRIALFAMKLELRDLQEALRKVAVLAQADGVVVGGWPSSSSAPGEEDAQESANGKDKERRQRNASTNLALAPMLNPIDRMVITKLHNQLGELLNTVESLE